MIITEENVYKLRPSSRPLNPVRRERLICRGRRRNIIVGSAHFLEDFLHRLAVTPSAICDKRYSAALSLGVVALGCASVHGRRISVVTNFLRMGRRSTRSFCTSIRAQDTVFYGRLANRYAFSKQSTAKDDSPYCCVELLTYVRTAVSLFLVHNAMMPESSNYDGSLHPLVHGSFVVDFALLIQ